MRRWSSHPNHYSVEFAPVARARLREFEPDLQARVHQEMEALAELADLAPIPHASTFGDGNPPLHLSLGDLVITYLIERGSRRIRVVDIEAA